MNRNRLIVPAAVLLLASANSMASPSASECNADSPSNCLDGVGPAVTNPDSLRVTSQQFSGARRTSDEDSSVAYRQTPRSTGLSAGSDYGYWGVWASYNRANFEADLPIQNANLPVASYDADQDSLMIGIDTLLANRWVLGVTGGYSLTDTFTAYNGGNNETEGYTVAPYLAYLINDTFSIDVSGGYTTLDYETDRIDNVSGGTLTADFDAGRWFVATNLNATVNHRNWYFGGRVGFMRTKEDQDGYTENGPNTARTILDRDISLSQAVVGADVAYNFGYLEPYATVSYLNDISRDDGVGAGGLPGAVGATQPDDDDEVQAGFGVRYFGNGVSGTLEWTSTIGRDTFEGDSLLLTFRADL